MTPSAPCIFVASTLPWITTPLLPGYLLMRSTPFTWLYSLHLAQRTSWPLGARRRGGIGRRRLGATCRSLWAPCRRVHYYSSFSHDIVRRHSVSVNDNTRVDPLYCLTELASIHASGFQEYIDAIQ